MNIEDKVCTFEQAKKFRELGVELKSFFVWWNNEYYSKLGVHIRGLWANTVETFPAYDVAELFQMTPAIIQIDGAECTFSIDKLPDMIIISYESKNYEKGFQQCYETLNLAQVLSDNLFWLIKDNHIKVEDLKL